MRRAALWSLTAISAIAYVVTVWIGLGSGSLGPQAWLWVFLGPPSFLVAALILFVKRPGHPIGEMLLLAALSGLVIPQILEVPVLLRYRTSGPEPWMWAPMWAGQTLIAVATILGATLTALLPDGRIRFRRDKWFLIAAWGTLPLPTLALLTNRTITRTEEMSFPGVTGVPSPLVIEPLERFDRLFADLAALPYLSLLGAVVLLVLRMRTASVRERAQLRWVLWATLVAAAVGVVPIILGSLGLVAAVSHGLAAFLVGFLPMLLFPAAVVIAVLEPPWIDFDFVIRTSFVYGSFSFAILLLYVSVAAALGMAAGSLFPLELAVVITVVAAALFQPARRRLQAWADRWVFGERPSRYEAVTDFGATIEAAADPEELLDRMVTTLQQAIRAEWVSVEFADGPTTRRGEEIGEPTLSIPIRSAGQEIGRLTGRVAGKIAAEDLSLAQTLAGQAGLAVANARLAARIVDAAEAERRRIERNIHDGAQQELVALVARLGMARAAAVRGQLTPDTLAELQEEAGTILSDLRELAQGIHPSILTDAGLLEAVEERCSWLPIEVTLRATPALRSERFRDDVEGAAYFFVTESLTNVLKHAHARSAEVTLIRQDGRLDLSVHDDGRGFAAGTIQQRGLAGLRDRITALGGTLELSSHPDTGTRISTSLPVS